MQSKRLSNVSVSHPYPLYFFPTKSYVNKHKYMKKSIFYRINIVGKGGIWEQYSFAVILGNVHHTNKLVMNFSVKLRPYVHAASSTMKPWGVPE